MCHMLQNKRKIGISKNGRPNRKKDAWNQPHPRFNMIGPILIRERRSDHKCYAALFTCFPRCVVHIELTNTIDGDSFIMALRRFLARRGSVRSIRSDNGTKFVGANNELQKALKEMDHQKFKNY